MRGRTTNILEQICRILENLLEVEKKKAKKKGNFK